MESTRMWQIFLAVVGTLMVVSGLIIGLNSLIFRHGFKTEAGSVLAAHQPDRGIITEADIAGLPAAVQRYVRYTGLIGREKVETIRLKQTGTIRQKPGEDWKNIEAVEYYTVNPPAYTWMGQMAAGPLNIVAARDSYITGTGRMFIKMLGTKTIGDVRGEEMDQSGLVRYLNEMMWFPAAFLNDNLRWEEIDARTARVTLVDGARSATAVMYFDEQGALTNFVSERFHEVDGVYVKDRWETPITGYGEFNGLRLPTRGEAVWKMSGGDFAYIRLEVTALEYNQAEVFN